MKIKKPMLFIEFRKDGEFRQMGPYYTASLDGLDIIKFKWAAYQVQETTGDFKRIIVPWYHTLSAMSD